MDEKNAWKNIPIYHTLEEDYEEWKQERKKKKLKTEEEVASVKQEEKDPSASTDNLILEENSKDADDSSKEDKKSDKKKGSKKQAAKGSTTPGMSSRELRNLMPEAPPVKKWGGKDAVLYEGQQELYDGLDNVLTKLKGHTEHSYPFLTRVRKADAPDYYDVIKHPMDLGTMTKKLQKCEYTSKNEFQADLNLIFNNCRTYNTDPSSKIYVTHADAMEKKAKELMRSVKNVDFSKQRAAGPPVKTEPSSLNSTPTNSAPSTPTISESAPILAPSTPPEAIAESSSPNKTKAKPTASASKGKKKKKAKTGKTKDESSPQKEETSSEFEEPEAVDFEQESLEEITKLDRIRYMQYRHEQSTLPFAEREALIRNSSRMSSFFEISSRLEPTDPNLVFSSLYAHEPEEDMKEGEEPEMEKSFCPEISHFMACVPEVYHPSHTDTAEVTLPTPSSLFKSNVLTSTGQLQQMFEAPMEENVATEQKPSWSFDMAWSVLRKSVAVLAAQAGFEAAEENAIDVFTDIASDYLQELGKVLKINRDAHMGKEPFSTVVDSILHGVEVTNGHSAVQVLKTYITSGHKAGKKVAELEKQQAQNLPPQYAPSNMDISVESYDLPESSLPSSHTQSHASDSLDPLNDEMLFPSKPSSMSASSHVPVEVKPDSFSSRPPVDVEEPTPAETPVKPEPTTPVVKPANPPAKRGRPPLSAKKQQEAISSPDAADEDKKTQKKKAAVQTYKKSKKR